jgi:hypothetical protein
MKLKNILLEFYSRVLPLCGLTGLLFLFMSIFIQGIRENFALSLFLNYAYGTVWYYLNAKILSRYVNMNGNDMSLYIATGAETLAFVIIFHVVRGLIRHGSINFAVIFKNLIFVSIYMAVCFSIIFFLQKSYITRVNKKLQEYKNQTDAIDYDSKQSRIEMLREFADYSADPKYSRKINFEYELGAKEKYQKIIKNFALDKITEGKQDFDLMFALLRFVSGTFGNDGNSGMPQKRDANSIIKFAQRKGGKINSIKSE